LGGDSILALKVVARARRAGWKLTPRQLFAHPTLAAAAGVAQPIPTASTAPGTSVEPAPPVALAAPVAPPGSRAPASSGASIAHPTSTALAATTRVPAELAVRLTPIQHRFLDRQRVDPHHYNQA